MSIRPVAAVTLVFALALLQGASAQEAPPLSAEHKDLRKQLLDEFEQARREKFPTLQELRDQSDVVVVATMVSEAIAPDGVRSEGFDERLDESIVTKLAVEATLAGKIDGESIEVVHVRWKEPIINLSNKDHAKFWHEIDVPNVTGIVFEDKYIESPDGGTRTIRPKYLVFLKRRADGRCELATGAVRNGSASVRWFDGREGP